MARRWLVQGLVAVEVSPASSLAVLEWEADPIADTVADAVSALLYAGARREARLAIVRTGRLRPVHAFGERWRDYSTVYPSV